MKIVVINNSNHTANFRYERDGSDTVIIRLCSSIETSIQLASNKASATLEVGKRGVALIELLPVPKPKELTPQ